MVNSRVWGNGRASSILFWCLLTLCWFATLGVRALIHPDEGRYAMLSLAMLQSGDWVTPRLNGLLYFEKPALQYWMGALSFQLFGINEFAARFWPGLTGMLSVLAVGLTGQRLWRCGQYAALVAAGSFWIIANSHFLTLDAGLTFFLALALCAFLWAQHDTASARENRYGMWLAWAAMAGAMLSKGLVGILIPGATLFLYSMLCGDWRVWRRMHWLAGMAIFVALAGPWFYVVAERNPGFLSFFFIREHFARYLTPEARREGPLWYFVPILLLGFLPWTSLLPRLLREGWQRQPGSFQAGRFAAVWALFVFVFFSLSHSKLPSYILPAFPALALLLGRVFSRIEAGELSRHLWLPVVAFAAAACLYPFFTQLVPLPSQLPEVRHLALVLMFGGAFFLGCAWLAWRQLRAGRILPAVMLLAAGNFGGVSAAMLGHDAYGQTYGSSKQIVRQLQPYLRADSEVFSLRGAWDQTFPFYLRRPVTLVDYRDEFAFGEEVEPAAWLPTIDQFIPRWQQAASAVALLENQDFDYLRSRNVPMQIVYRDARRLVVVKP